MRGRRRNLIHAVIKVLDQGSPSYVAGRAHVWTSSRAHLPPEAPAPSFSFSNLPLRLSHLKNTFHSGMERGQDWNIPTWKEKSGIQSFPLNSRLRGVELVLGTGRGQKNFTFHCILLCTFIHVKRWVRAWSVPHPHRGLFFFLFCPFLIPLDLGWAKWEEEMMKD